MEGGGLGKASNRKYGICQICTKYLKLSYDHVPPKCVQTNLNIVYKNVLGIKQNPHHKMLRFSQDGVGYRTICTGCNNLLGYNYDWALKDLVVEIRKYAETSISLPSPIVNIKCRPVLIAKSIIGHILAAQPDFQNCPIDNTLRNFYIKCDNSHNLFIHYWYYPYEQIRVFRDFIMRKKRTGEFTNPSNDCGVFHLLQFYPIAFCITDFPVYENLMNFNPLLDNDDELEAEIQIDLSNPAHERWPIIADGNNFIVGGKSIVDSIEAQGRS